MKFNIRNYCNEKFKSQEIRVRISDKEQILNKFDRKKIQLFNKSDVSTSHKLYQKLFQILPDSESFTNN